MDRPIKNQSSKHIDMERHVRGTSLYVDDLPLLDGTLFAHVVQSPVAHGRIINMDFQPAMQVAGVKHVICARDIPGENQIGGIFPDEPLFAEGTVHFCGQPIALVVAESEAIARHAAAQVVLEIEELKAVVKPRDAFRAGSIIGKTRTFELGEPDRVWQDCSLIVEGQGDCGGQEHLYIETQGAYAIPGELGHVRIVSSTQGPTAVQRTAARVLKLPMHAIEVDVTRLGGGFGGKEDQATPWAVMAALAALLLKRPVKLVLHRLDDMAMTGKRHPYEFDYKIGLNEEHKILAYEVMFYQDAGAAADLSPAVLERTLFHFTNSYFVPNARATATSCRTHVTPHTAFRGFGGPQGMFAIEAAIEHAASQLHIPAYQIQQENLLSDGDMFPYGQVVGESRARDCLQRLKLKVSLPHVHTEIEAFNQENPFKKRGFALMPICFGISFTKTHMNQAGALVHVYQDGSVSVSTGAVEMGQGVSTKMAQVAADVFGLGLRTIKVESTNTTRIANTSPTAASASADLNGHALLLACGRVAARMLAVAAELTKSTMERVNLISGRVYVDDKTTELSFADLAQACYLQRINLSEHAHYATPGLNFDSSIERGHPFAYHVYGCALVTATVDILRGIYEIDRVQVVHDFGSSMNLNVDLGQTEGGIVQGLGWMTMEELVFDNEGKLRSNALSTYKVPDVYAAPKSIDVEFLGEPGSSAAIFRSKAVGEPPLMYGIGGYFAVRNAMGSYKRTDMPFSAPITPEKVMMGLRSTKASRSHASEAISESVTR